jgi:hypothetical protein
VSGYGQVYGHAQVSGHTLVFGNTQVYKDIQDSNMTRYDLIDLLQKSKIPWKEVRRDNDGQLVIYTGIQDKN